MSNFWKSFINCVVGMASTISGFAVSHLHGVKETLQVCSLTLGLLVGFVTLGNLLKGMGFHLPLYDWLIEKFGHKTKEK